MHDEYVVESGFKATDWTQVLHSVRNLLSTMEVVSVKRYINGKYISTFYFTHAF